MSVPGEVDLAALLASQNCEMIALRKVQEFTVLVHEFVGRLRTMAVPVEVMHFGGAEFM